MFKLYGWKCRFEMVEVKEEMENELIVCDCFLRDDEWEGKFDRVVECKGIDCCRN